MDAATSATNVVDARKIEKAVKTAFKIYRFDHLEPTSLEVVMRIFNNKGWVLPTDLSTVGPEKERTLLTAIKDYLEMDARHKSKRNLYAIDRFVEFFGESKPLREIKAFHVKQYRSERQLVVENGTVNREFSVLSGIFRVQIELENIDYNPCAGIRGLPANQRDTYLSFADFNRLLEHSWWLKEILLMLYFTGMRFNELVAVRWEMYKPNRRMLVLPPQVTKEGKSERKLKLQSKRIPLRREPFELLEFMRKGSGNQLFHATGPIFIYQGRYKNHCGTYQGKPISWSMVKKAWKLAIGKADLKGLQMKDLRHSWKTNAHRSRMDATTRNCICGHSSRRAVEDLYINLSDEELLKAVDEMTFDNGWTQLNVVEAGVR